MDNLQLRGYVTPEDFSGTDTEKLQKALDYAAQADIRKVVVSGSYTVATALIVPAQTHLRLEGGILTAAGDFPILQSEKHQNFSFEQKWFCIDGSGILAGGLYFFNASHIVLEGLTVTGTVTLEYCHDVRMEHLVLKAPLHIGQGCFNFILQKLEAETEDTAVLLSPAVSCGDTVPGREPNLRSIILRDSRLLTDAPAVALKATEDGGFVNIQADHITARATAVAVGSTDCQMPPEQYFNLTFTDLCTPAAEKIQLLNPVKHAYIR